MQKFIPIFPLNLVAYPGEKLNLHIFEPRYKQLIHECFEEGKTFGIPVVDKNEIQEYGTEMEILDMVREYDTGEMDIKINGIQVFRILDVIKELPEKLYSGAIVSIQENITDHHTRTSMELTQLAHELFTLLDIKDDVFKNDFVLSSYALAHLVGFSLQEELELLRHQRETSRQKIILEHIKTILPGVRQMAEIKQKAKLNGHFRMVNPPDFL